MDHDEFFCLLCGLPCHPRSCQMAIKALHVRGLVTTEHYGDLDTALDWLEDIVLLCDPVEEVGRLVPNTAYRQLNQEWNHKLHLYQGALSFFTPDKRAKEMNRLRTLIDICSGVSHQGGASFIATSAQDFIINVDNRGDVSTPDGRAYLPVHRRCLDMATLVMGSKSSTSEIKSMRGLWTTLRWRLGIGSHFGYSDCYGDHSTPSRYWYLPPWDMLTRRHKLLTGVAQWPGPSKLPLFDLYWTCFSDPWEVENLTEFLVSNLTEYRPADVRISADDATFAHRFMTLPQRIMEWTFSNLRHTRNLPYDRGSAYLLPQVFWMRELILGTNGLLPWLWDLDVNMILEKKAQECPSGPEYAWDWELLVRKLTCGVDAGLPRDFPEDMHPDDDVNVAAVDRWACSGYDDIFHDVPLGLHNRRRIWQMLEEMYVGDTNPLVNIHVLPRDFGALDRGAQNFWKPDGSLREDGPVWVPYQEWKMVCCRKVGGRVYRAPESR